jgi:hypothetical protein
MLGSAAGLLLPAYPHGAHSQQIREASHWHEPPGGGARASAEVAPVRRRGGLGVGRKLVAPQVVRLWRLAYIYSSF